MEKNKKEIIKKIRYTVIGKKNKKLLCHRLQDKIFTHAKGILFHTLGSVLRKHPRKLNRLEFCRYIEALQCNSDGGVYECKKV